MQVKSYKSEEMNLKEFKLRKELIDYEHKVRMEELEYTRQTSILIHQQKLEYERIKAAAIRRQYERKDFEKFKFWEDKNKDGTDK